MIVSAVQNSQPGEPDHQPVWTSVVSIRYPFRMRTNTGRKAAKPR